MTLEYYFPIYFQEILTKRQHLVVGKEDHCIINNINKLTAMHNKDNITRTKAYLHFYQKNTEIIWALLASMVSRNAGWNMTDLKLPQYRRLFSMDFLMILFHSYERPNWLIFQDAFPQLLIYEYSKQLGRPLFYLLKHFNVSIFMEHMWEVFWKLNNRKLLCFAQIINEQQLIQNPVIKHSFYKEFVFDSIIYHMQEFFHANAVIFPTLQGKLYGFSVYRFNHINKRIGLGKQLLWLLFDSNVSKDILDFAENVIPTGSRNDYEQFLPHHNNINVSPPLQHLYHKIEHKKLNHEDWFQGVVNPEWFNPPHHFPNYRITDWYRTKREQVVVLSHLYQIFRNVLK